MFPLSVAAGLFALCTQLPAAAALHNASRDSKLEDAGYQLWYGVPAVGDAAKAASTTALGQAELTMRKIEFGVLFAGGAVFMVVLGVVALYKKRGRVNPGWRVDIFREGYEFSEPVDIEDLVLAQEMLTRKNNARWLVWRSRLLWLLFACYISKSVGIPLWNSDQVSCANGFFWEDHLLFFGLFLCTKFAELGLFVYDPTIKGDMGLMVFLMKFVPSFLGYLDGYTDATAITIAFACNHNEVAQKIGPYMVGTYIVGVILCQWVVVAYLAAQDSTHACLMKLIHFDVVSACVSLPESSKTTWFVVNMARTFGEDIPQAFLQTLFLMYVRKNYFMIASVALSVLSSMKALYDAVNRAAVGLGATLDSVPVCKYVGVRH